MLLTGCGATDNGTSNTFNTQGLPQPSPVDLGASLQATNFQAAATTLLNAAYTDGGGPGLTGSLGGDSRHPLAVAADIQAAYRALLAGGNNTLPAPGGGSASATVNGTSATLVLNGFSTSNGTISGTVLFSGTATNTGFVSNATFNGVQVVPAGGRPYRIDGPTTMNATFTGPTSFLTIFGSNMTVTDGNGGSYRYLNSLSITNVTDGSNVDRATGSQLQSGGFIFNNWQGLTGAVNETTPQPLRLINNILESGQWLFQGSGQIRVTALGSNNILIEGAPVSGVFSPVNTVNYANIFTSP